MDMNGKRTRRAGSQTMNLFRHAYEERLEREQPLAARMRPRTLDEFVGQDHILAPGRLLRRAIQADQLSSLIFYGPPGTGKTTLASVIAITTRSHFEVLNAVLAGIADIRAVTEAAQQRRGEHDQRTILFVDEVHRWNKAQQDALLPWVENGVVVLIGATTENPYFTVNRALVSRSRIFQLKPLGPRHLEQVVANALQDPIRGYGQRRVDIAPEALAHLVAVANGDARALLNAIELAVETTPLDPDSRIAIDMGVAEESIQQRAVLYDKEGDYHFDTISAFIKSMRGSDPDATMYWLAKMVYAGEDPRFLFRRMVIFAAEDVGLADPNALVATMAAAEAFDRVGMPEGRYHLGMAALYLATAPKSNSVVAFFDALATVEKEQEGEVPNHLRDGSRDKEGFGHGEGYLYPHAYRDHWVAQQYLPQQLQGKMFYRPGTIGYEQSVAEQTQQRREAQLAAALDPDAQGAPPEILTASPADRAFDRWLQRTTSGTSDRLATIRHELFELAQCQRNARVLVLDAHTGLFVWEAVRQTPEGGVWAQVPDQESAASLAHQASFCPSLRAPTVISQPEPVFPAPAKVFPDRESRVELIVGRNWLTHHPCRLAGLKSLAACLAEGGRLVLAEVVPRYTQRLYEMLDLTELTEALAEGLKQAEEGIYTDETDPLVNWDEEALHGWFGAAGLAVAGSRQLDQTIERVITDALLDDWFVRDRAGGRRSYAMRLAGSLSAEDVTAVEHAFRRQLRGKSMVWGSRVVLVSGVAREA